MVLPADNATMSNGDPMDLGAAEADLDTEMTTDAPNSTGSPLSFPLQGPGHGFSNIQVLTNETPSIFDAFPEAFNNGQADDADSIFYGPSGLPSNTGSIYGQCPKTSTIDPDRLPYSYMIEHAGRVPKILSRVDPAINVWVHRIRNPLQALTPIFVKTDNTPAFNIAGEEALERRLRQIPNPVNYLIVVRGFRLLMAIRNMTIGNKAPLDAKTIGVLIGRLFCGDPISLKIFNKYFLPKNLEIVPDMADGEIQAHYSNLYGRLTKSKAIWTPEIVKLLSLLEHLAREPLYSHRWQQEYVGRLKMVKSYTSLEDRTVEVPPGGAEVPFGPELPRCVDLSPDFMRRFGKRWPFDVRPAMVDVCGLVDERRPKPATLRPQQLYRVSPSEK